MGPCWSLFNASYILLTSSDITNLRLLNPNKASYNSSLVRFQRIETFTTFFYPILLAYQHITQPAPFGSCYRLRRLLV